MTARSRHDEIRARADALLQYVSDGTDGLMTPQMIHLADAADVLAVVAAVPALLDALAAADARAEKAEEALRELVTATTTWDDDLSSYCDGDDRTRVREALVAARDVLAAAAGETGDTE